MRAVCLLCLFAAIPLRSQVAATNLQGVSVLSNGVLFHPTNFWTTNASNIAAAISGLPNTITNAYAHTNESAPVSFTNAANEFAGTITNTGGVPSGIASYDANDKLTGIALPSDSTKFLNGTGAFTVPAGGSGSPIAGQLTNVMVPAITNVIIFQGSENATGSPTNQLILGYLQTSTNIDGTLSHAFHYPTINWTNNATANSNAAYEEIYETSEADTVTNNQATIHVKEVHLPYSTNILGQSYSGGILDLDQVYINPKSTLYAQSQLQIARNLFQVVFPQNFGAGAVWELDPYNGGCNMQFDGSGYIYWSQTGSKNLVIVTGNSGAVNAFFWDKDSNGGEIKMGDWGLPCSLNLENGGHLIVSSNAAFGHIAAPNSTNIVETWTASNTHTPSFATATNGSTYLGSNSLFCLVGSPGRFMTGCTNAAPGWAQLGTNGVMLWLSNNWQLFKSCASNDGSTVVTVPSGL